MVTKVKLQESFDSANFTANITALILLIFAAVGVELPTQDSGEYLGEISSLIGVVVVWVINPIRSFIKKLLAGNIDWSFLWDGNTVTAIVSVLGVIGGIWFDETTIATMGLVLTNLANVLIKMFIRPAKLETVPV